jgi:hypothetical protein
MMSLRTGTHQSAPTPQGMPNNIMHPTRSMGLGFSRWWLRAGDDERYDRYVATRSMMQCEPGAVNSVQLEQARLRVEVGNKWSSVHRTRRSNTK